MAYLTSNCEVLAKLVCKASLLKDHDYRLKSKSFSQKVCNACYLGIREDTKHIVMQCPTFEGIKSEMFDIINAIEDENVQRNMNETDDLFNIIMGKHPMEIPFDSMLKIWLVSSR